VIGVLYWDF